MSKYHRKVILEEIDSFSTGRHLFFFGRKENGSTSGGVVCLGRLVLIIRESGMSLWVCAKTSVGHGFFFLKEQEGLPPTGFY
jgi:hypothetical protein